MSASTTLAAASGSTNGGGGWLSVSRLLVAAGVGFGVLALKRFANGPLSPYTAANTDLSGKVVVVTGANAGLGRAAALELMAMGAHVVLACRDAAKAARAVAELTAELTAELHPAAAAAPAAADVKGQSDAKQKRVGTAEAMTVDVSDPQSVRAFAAAFKARHTRLHVLLHNAGMPDTAQRTVTAQGVETLFATNHLGAFLLTQLLLDSLKASAPARVVVVSSGLEALADLDLTDLNFVKRPYVRAYEQSKLCNILFARELARRLDGTGVKAVSLRPGFVPSTDLSTKIPGVSALMRTIGLPLLWPICKDLRHGVATIVHCAAAPHDALVSGAYYGDCALQTPRHKLAADDGVAKKLWDVSDAMTAAADAVGAEASPAAGAAAAGAKH